MQRLVILAATALVVVLVLLIQFGLPPLLESQAEDRLTKQGGTATVELSALPSPRLLFKEGDSLRVRADGISTALADANPTSTSALGDLDGFDSVDLQATNMRIGPFAVARLTLKRDASGGPYRAAIRATITGADLSTFAGQTFGGGLGGLLGSIAGGAMPLGQAQIPIDLDAVLRSDGGRVRTEAVNGSVAGLPAGPLVELLAAALAARF